MIDKTLTGRPTLAETACQRVAPVLRVLGHADRLRMADLLLRGEMSVADLARTLKLAPNAVSQHLNIMLAHGILQRSRRGRCVIYSVVHPAAKTLVRCMWRNAGRGGRP